MTLINVSYQLQIWSAVALFLLVSVLSQTAHALSAEDARHLTERIAFGESADQLRRMSHMSRENAVEMYVQQASRGCESETVPYWASDRLESAPATDADSQLRHQKKRYGRRVALQTWWLNGMVASTTPLCDRLALFWHQYFPIQVHQTTSESAAIRQVQRLRQQALGNFRDILRDMSRDPAMQEFLGLTSNRKAHPNENYARELMELYTLGSGHYSEQDVREAARAYTGWRTIRRLGLFVMWWPDHDFGQKQFLGQTGRWDGDDVVDIILQQPRTAEFMVEKLWREFISPTPAPAEVSRLAALLRRDWEIRPVIDTLLRSPYFWAADSRGTLTKSPVDLAVGVLRQAGASPSNGNALAAWTWAMGQGLYFPPDVKGWRGGAAWITAQTLQTRESFLSGLASGYSDDVIATLVQQVYEYPGFDEQSLMADSSELRRSLSTKARAEVATKASQLAYQLK